MLSYLLCTCCVYVQPHFSNGVTCVLSLEENGMYCSNIALDLLLNALLVAVL